MILDQCVWIDYPKLGSADTFRRKKGALMRIWLASVFSLALCFPAMAADRLFDMVGFNGKSTFYIDTQSKQMNPPIATFWTLAVNPPDNIAKGAIAPHYLVAKININCNEKTAQTISNVAYGKNNELLGSSTAPAPVIPIVPNTFFDNEYKYVCLGVKFNPSFKMIAHVKDAVDYADTMIKLPADAPSPND